MDAPMRSLGGRTVPDGAVGINQRVGWNLFLKKNKQACPFIRKVRVGTQNENNC